MKKKYYIVILLLFCGVLIAIGIKANSFKVPKAVKAEMEAAWLEQNGRELPWNGEDGYYGTYNGAVVYINGGQLTMITKIEVAGEEFSWPNSFVIYAYKDGEFYDLETAYEKGILTKWNIKSIAKRHDEYLSERTNRGDYRP